MTSNSLVIQDISLPSILGYMFTGKELEVKIKKNNDELVRVSRNNKVLENDIKSLRIKDEENLKSIEKMEKQINELIKKLNCYIGKTIIPENGIKEYDIIIDIPAVDYFSQKDTSWLVFLSQKLKEKMNGPNGFNPSEPFNSLFAEFKKYSTLACLGCFNIGKTFFINKYNNSYLPSGTQSQTIGLSLSICHNNETITIDTAGSNTSLKVGENRSEEQLARKESTEMFIRDMSFSLANTIVYVLNELTWTDQRFILALQSKIQSLRTEQKINKTLIIVHNYPKINSMEELLVEIKTYMDHPFNGTFHHQIDFKTIKSKDEVVLFFTESVNNSYHFFLCNDNSEFGKKYNDLTIEKIRSTNKEYNDKLDFDKVLLSGLQNNMVSYCKSPSKLKISEFTKDDKIIENCHKEMGKILFDKESGEFSEYLKELTEIYEKVIPHKTIISQIPVFKIYPENDSNRENEFKLIDNKVEFIGLQMVFWNGFRPNYDIVKVGSDLRYLIEVPQMVLAEISHETKYENTKWNLIVKGVKKLQFDMKNSDSGYPSEETSLCLSNNQRRDGSFELILNIPNNYHPKNPEVVLEKGVLCFTFKLIE
ncbi:hypothetical protein ACTFIY_012581 [Dictyostelium cf. discoideum]